MSSKLREALEKILAIAKDEFEDIYNAGRIEDLCREALAEPIRNFDVGTAEEQDERFMNFCQSHYDLCNDDGECWKCPLLKTKTRCSIAWSHMPYEEGDNNANK